MAEPRIRVKLVVWDVNGVETGTVRGPSVVAKG